MSAAGIVMLTPAHGSGGHTAAEHAPEGETLGAPGSQTAAQEDQLTKRKTAKDVDTSKQHPNNMLTYVQD
jgi:hypothetical protein